MSIRLNAFQSMELKDILSGYNMELREECKICGHQTLMHCHNCIYEPYPDSYITILEKALKKW